MITDCFSLLVGITNSLSFMALGFLLSFVYILDVFLYHIFSSFLVTS